MASVLFFNCNINIAGQHSSVRGFSRFSSFRIPPISQNMPEGGWFNKLPFSENDCVNMCVHGIPALLPVFQGLDQDPDQDKPVNQEWMN